MTAILPALTAEEWTYVKRGNLAGFCSHVGDLETAGATEQVQAIAVANHFLPHGHPQKLTREDEKAAWYAARVIGETEARKEMIALARKLSALLPPE